MSKSAELRTSPLHNKQHSTIKDNHNASRISGDMRESSVKLAELEATFPKDLEGDELFQTNYVTNWTISDQYRLLAMDRLQARTLEYHNNVHQRFAFDNNGDTSGVEPDDIVAQILYCSSVGSERPFTTTQAKFGSVLSQIKLREQKSRNSTSWVHLFDLCELTTIAECFNMHPLCAASFRDLRCHSNIVQSSNGFVVSLCYFQMNNSHFNVQMFKLYCYISHGLIVTFIAELMPETDVQTGADGAPGGGYGEDDGGVNICSTVLDRWTKIINKTCELGPLYLFCEIALEAMTQQDSLIEFFSRTLFFFKKKTNLSLSHRKKVAFMRKMHIVMSAIQLIQFNVESISHIVSKLVLKAEASAVAAAAAMSATITLAAIPPVATVGSSIRDPVMPLVPGSLVGGDQLPYLYDLQDTCEFLDDCLKNEANEARILTDAMDSISQLKANNTAMLLSLVATIFLPVTFLTGVFGMNFTIDGGFTIDMVNNPNGPLLFYLMCGATSLITLAYYFSKGWIDVYTIQNYFSSVFGCKKNKARFVIDKDARDTVPSNPEATAVRQRSLSVKRLMKTSSVTRYSESDWQVQEAVDEEARRLAESARKRSRAQNVVKINARNSAIRFSTVNGSVPVSRHSS